MKFLDPTLDITFKKIFGDKKSSDILISFLNSVLERNTGERIAVAEFVDPHNNPKVLTDKYSCVDIKCKDEQGLTYIVEMQIIDQADFLHRCQYYLCAEVARQLQKGDSYKKLKPVIFVGIAHFTLFKNSSAYISHHMLLDNKSFQNELELIQFHFLELSKFNKSLDMLEPIDQWAYFLKHASQADEIPFQLKSNKEIVEAFHILENANFTKTELAEYDRLMDIVRSDMGRMEGAELSGKKKALNEVAKKLLLKGFTVKEISDITGLSDHAIKQIEM